MKHIILCFLFLTGCASTDITVNGYKISKEEVLVGTVIGVVGGIVIYEVLIKEEKDTKFAYPNCSLRPIPMECLAYMSVPF